MSYCRIGPDSDIYLIATFGGKWDCFCKSPCVTMDSLEDVQAHLLNHVRGGDKVPSYALARVDRELNKRPVGESK